jgi:hypothetical protein
MASGAGSGNLNRVSGSQIPPLYYKGVERDNICRSFASMDLLGFPGPRGQALLPTFIIHLQLRSGGQRGQSDRSVFHLQVLLPFQAG